MVELVRKENTVAKKISTVSAERFASGVNKKNPHSGKKIRFNWLRRKGGQNT